MKRVNLQYEFRRCAFGLIAISAVISAIVGCGTVAVEGGYAEPCDLQVDGEWTTSGGTLYLKYPEGQFTFGAHHYPYKSEIGIHIDIGGAAFQSGRYSNEKVLYSPTAARMHIAGKTIAADPLLRSVGSSLKLGCEDAGATPFDLNHCSSATIYFDTAASIEGGFALDLGELVIRGIPHRIPVIKFCYKPRTLKAVPLHS